MKNAPVKQDGEKGFFGLDRREFIKMGLALAATSMLPSIALSAGTPAAHLKGNVHRKLGALEVSSIGLGCMNVAWGFGPPVAKQDAVQLIRHAYDRGVTYFDSAEVYGPFLSEEFVGEALASVRDKVVIASKFGFDISPSGEIRGLNSRPEHIRNSR